MKHFNLPDLGEGLAEAEIVRWHVSAGDHVKVDDPMLAVETAKAIVEVPSPICGVVKSTHGKPGDRVATGTLLVEFEPHASEDAGTVVGRMPATSDADFFSDPLERDSRAAPQGAHVKAVPAARALARKLGLDLTHVQGTGRGQSITVDDVLQAAPPIPDGAEQLHGPRRAMAQTMALARDTVMGCTLFDDADLHEWSGGQPGAGRGAQDITARLLRAIAAASGAEPGLNAWFDGSSQTRRVLDHIDVAIAVDTPDGLIAPVVRDIGRRPVAELRREIDTLKRSALDRTVGLEDLREFTFMLSNFGTISGRYATPVVVPPAVAILGSGRLSRDVVATRDGAIETHLRMPLSLTFDHRCVTGGEAARFMAALIRDLQKGN